MSAFDQTLNRLFGMQPPTNERAFRYRMMRLRDQLGVSPKVRARIQADRIKSEKAERT